ncbi:MAG TPA: arylsulfotransferase family protein [Gaiellaceae bacterium]|nr:arylsulfotransferase family protein [Gaiellaceae bacterium]
MAWEGGLTRSQLVQRGARAAVAGSLLAGADLLARAGEAFGAAGALKDTRHFVSRPDLHPPTLTVLRRGKTAPGSLFLAPSSGPGQRGLLIADEAGEPIWFHPTTPHTAMNFRTAVYHGKPVLTWWEGKAESGLGTGTHVILDDRYRVIARVPAGGGRQSDLHEFLITPQNTALLTSYEVRDADLTSVGGPSNGKVIGGLVHEVALPSGRVLFEWKSLDHVDIAETHAPWVGHPLDYFHINSIDLAADGSLLVSARNTWAVYKVSRRTGDVRWRLGGKRSDFKMGKGTVFAWQHDARHQGHNRITIFDDGAQPQVEPQSRGLVIQLDQKSGTARLVRKYVHEPNKIVSRFMGNLQALDNGNVMIGWGSEPYLTEFGPDGEIALDVRLPHGGQNYRAFRLPWRAAPSLPPTAVYRFARGKGTVYASWNGATEVAAWRLDSGPRTGALRAGSAVARKGFETALRTTPGDKVAHAVALDASGRVLGRSKAIRI